MITLLSILTLLLLWALLAAIERIPWPLSRNTGLYSNDPDYLAAVVRESNAYLATHHTVPAQIRRSVAAMAVAAQQRLGGLTR